MRRWRTPWLLVPAGVAIGHLAAYALAHPNALDRQHALAGHAHFPLVMTAALVAAVSALVWATVLEHRGWCLRADWRSLAAGQVASFAVLEGAEHLVTSGSLPAVVLEPALWVGLVAQLPVAWLLSVALRWVPHLAASLLRRASTTPEPARTPCRRPVWVEPRRISRTQTPRSPRAPPVLRCC